mmetsp:Transcript_10483/g.28748  ORF Transcript_10483/g.28748 Transcript_10483/m.28748 type:complete len:210 (-) Transcript_10483:2800-3429(-)
MYSMNRTLTSFSLVSSTKSNNSSSLTPFITTTFTFTGVYPSSSASSIAAMTRPCPFLLVSCTKRSGLSVSRDRLRRLSPLSRSSFSVRESTRPFEVIPTSFIPGMDEIRRTISGKSFRTVGSPPVNRTFVTPALANSRTSRSISSTVKSSVDGVRSTPPSGMQYTHRREHFSLIEIRRYVCLRENPSVIARCSKYDAKVGCRCPSTVDV